MKGTYPKANFVQLVSYWQENMDFEKLERDNMTEVYFEGMKYFEQIAGKAGKVRLFPEDIQLLLLMRGDKHFSIEELSELLSVETRSMNKRIYKLVVRGYVSSYKERKHKYFKLTPYGEKQLVEEILK